MDVMGSIQHIKNGLLSKKFAWLTASYSGVLSKITSVHKVEWRGVYIDML